MPGLQSVIFSIASYHNAQAVWHNKSQHETQAADQLNNCYLSENSKCQYLHMFINWNVKINQCLNVVVWFFCIKIWYNTTKFKFLCVLNPVRMQSNWDICLGVVMPHCPRLQSTSQWLKTDLIHTTFGTH